MAATLPPRRLPLVGAIRWDAWFGDLSYVGLMVEKTLGPQHWHNRLPFFAQVDPDAGVQVRGNTRAIMDQEIAYAAAAGLDYWAFVIYPPADALSAALHLYLQSPIKSQINFCLNLQGGWLGSEAAWPECVRLYLGYFREPTYQTVLGDRPLVYLFNAADMLGPERFASEDFARQAFDTLRAACRHDGVGDPYVVVQDWSSAVAHHFVELLGGDAVSAYASDGRGQGAPFEALAAHTQSWWDEFAATGSPVVPLATAGWDPRPRIETPTPWHDYGSADHYYETPTPQALAAHVRAAIQWVRDHPQAAEANAVLIYAWNEFDEGGWLAPTLSEGSARLDALKVILRRDGAAMAPNDLVGLPRLLPS
jgi:hypothetical protein